MAQFSKFNFLFALKLNFNGGLISKRNIKICLFPKVGKSQNKVVVAEEIGCRNDKVLSTIV